MFAALLQRLAQVVHRPGLTAGVLVLVVQRQRLAQLVHRRPRLAVHQPGARQLCHRPGLTALVVRTAVELHRRLQCALRRGYVAPPQMHLAELEVRPGLAVDALALLVELQRLPQHGEGLGDLRAVALHRRQGVQRPGPVAVHVRSGLKLQRLTELGRGLDEIALLLERDAQIAQRTGGARRMLRLEVQIDHRRQRRPRLVQLAQLPGRHARTPLHRTDQQPLPDGPGQLAQLAQAVEVTAQQAVVGQRAQQMRDGRLVHALVGVAQRGRDEAGLVVQPLQGRVQGGEAMGPEAVGAGGRTAVDQPDHRVGQLRVGADQPLLGRAALARLLLVHQTVVRKAVHEGVQAVALAAHMLDQPRPGQRRQLPLRLRLLDTQQRRRGRRPQARPAHQRQPAQQPPGRLRLVGVAQRQRTLHRRHRAVGRQVRGQCGGGARAERGARHPQRQGQARAQLGDLLDGP